MKRRDFLRNSAAASAPLVLGGSPLFAAPSTGNSLFDFIGQSSQSCGKILVIIQQNGGNDGLNAVIPKGTVYDQIQPARANVMLPKASILNLSGRSDVGLHAAMGKMQALFDAGKLTVVQGVSYPNPNFSHFRATDIWFSGSASNEYLETGWLGRNLNITYPNYPTGYPSAAAPDPLAVQIGSSLPFSLQGPAVNMGYNVPSNANLEQIINGTTDPAPANDYGRELTFLRLMTSQSNAYRQRIKNAYDAQPNLSPDYPASGNNLANQLKTVARLIGGGLTTPIYIVNHPASHDTHENQVNADLINGWQFNNLKILSEAIHAFQDDIQRMGKAAKVSGMTFSEFGRRVKSNDSVGTDHGTAAPVFFFGASLQPGVLGTPPVLTGTITNSTQIPMQYDFRQLYATVMQDWLCMTAAESATVLGSSFNKLPVFSSGVLPLDGVALTGQYYQGRSRLHCKAEQNGKYRWYALEFSADGTRFTEVARRLATGSTAGESYSYEHQASAPKMFYRIAAEDHQGRIDYSNVVQLRASDKAQVIRLYPNPVQGNKVYIEFLETVTGPVDVTIYDLIGARHYYNRFNGVQASLSFRVPPAFNRETHYILEVKYGATTAREQIIFR